MSPAAARSLTSKYPASNLNLRSPEVNILFLYFQNVCGFRTSSATTHYCSAPFLEGGAVSVALFHHGAGCGLGPLALTLRLIEKESTIMFN